MRTLVYAHRSRAAEAMERVARLRSEGATALYRDTRGFDGSVEDCDLVVTDDPHVAHVHQERGIAVQSFGSPAAVAVPQDIPRPAAPDSDGYRVEQRGTWFSLVDPDGNKVGTSQRSEAEAWALKPGAGD